MVPSLVPTAQEAEVFPLPTKSIWSQSCEYCEYFSSLRRCGMICAPSMPLWKTRVWELKNWTYFKNLQNGWNILESSWIPVDNTLFHRNWFSACHNPGAKRVGIMCCYWFPDKIQWQTSHTGHDKTHDIRTTSGQVQKRVVHIMSKEQWWAMQKKSIIITPRNGRNKKWRAWPRSPALLSAGPCGGSWGEHAQEWLQYFRNILQPFPITFVLLSYWNFEFIFHGHSISSN